jgi:anthranilate synthase component 1
LNLSLTEFQELAKKHRVIPVTRQILADESTPVALYQKLTDAQPGTFLLESAENDKSWSRWSFIGVKSAAHLIIDETGAHWHGRVPSGLIDHQDPIEALRNALETLQTSRFAELPPLTGGLVGAFSYEFVHNLESLVAQSRHTEVLPRAVLLLTTDMAAVDHHSGKIWLIANAVNFDNTAERVEQAYQDAVSRLDEMQQALKRPSLLLPMQMREAKILVETLDSDLEYETAVTTAKEHIYAGDAFQVVLSRKFKVKVNSNSLDIYRMLRATNPSPYMYHFNLPIGADNAIQIVGASPEALLKVFDDECLLHPIAGTRPRGATITEDLELENELLSDAKERAEHLMLVDLGRNDLGKVSMPGSVEVTEFMKIERYSHVMHIVSTITSKLDAGKTALDALLGTFPAGTLSGAPKPRAMQIIDELEGEVRGFYGGAVGYFDFAGNLDMAITIRTLVIQNGVAIAQAGAGVVADSNPKNENQECKNKVGAVLRAISLAEGSSTL